MPREFAMHKPMHKQHMLRRRDRNTLKRLFTWIECLSALTVAILLGLALLA
jgi:hypothetical protein